jgi:DNA replication and repair protein RecF
LVEGLFASDVLKIHYLSTVAAESRNLPEVETHFRERLAATRAGDRQKGFTSVGPHRDELKMYLNAKSLGEYGSAGQQRSSLLTLYFAQMEIHRKQHGFYPAFLVDDVEAELDDRRLRTFLGYLSERTQTFLTTAKESILPMLPGPIRRFEIRAGESLSN